LPHPSIRLSRRSILVAVVAATALACVSGLLVATSHLAQTTHHASEQAVVAAAHDRSEPGHEPGATAPTPSVRDALFIGASYTAGLGATPATNGYAYLLGREPGWQTQVYGVAGTGFLNPGPRGHQTFADRVEHIPTHPRPNLVVFQCGRNDVGYPPAQLRAAVIATADLARKRFVGAQLVFLGPIPAHVPAPPDQLAVTATLASAAAAAKAIFVNPIEQGWITPTNETGYVGRVPAHPDNEGYAYIAERLLADLNALYPDHHNA
jgi:acyl-CoA thioesterase-1